VSGAFTGTLTVLCGGVGGAKLVDGLASVIADPSRLTVIVNSADDWDVWGLRVCPDVDTVLYTLAGIVSPERGWGIDGETWHALEMLAKYGLPAWFQIGDRDLATHVARTAWLRAGRRLTEVTRFLAGGLGVRARVLPMCDEPVATVVETPDGPLPFQEYFVARRASDPVKGITFRGIAEARPTPDVLEALHTADIVVVAPSNPLVSIGPILSVPGMLGALSRSPAVRIAVTPLIGGRAIKGPTVDMLLGLGLDADPAAVASLYREFLDIFLLDIRDGNDAPRVAAAFPGLAVESADTLMVDTAARCRLARDVLRIAAAYDRRPRSPQA
jgi:LPPG:FO 2-phospho-L-lactate transferase